MVLENLHPPFMTVVHSLALDEGGNRLFVADRENQRILIFDTMTGNYKSQIQLDQPVYAIAFEKTCGELIKDLLFSVVCLFNRIMGLE